MAPDVLTGIPFRQKLLIFAGIITALIGIPLTILALKQPWQRLESQVAISRNLIAAVRETVPPEDLRAMNRFAQAQIAPTSTVSAEMRIYLDWTFNMLLLNNRLLSRDEIVRTVREEQVPLEAEIDYPEIERSYAYWQSAFADNPQLLETFRTHKRYMVAVKDQVNPKDIRLADLYLMLDTGASKGFFKNRIAFVLDGYQWYESAFPGDEYYPPPQSNLRGDSLSGKQGYGNSRLIDPSRGFLPGFYTDDWGNWFSVWHTSRQDNLYSLFVTDFAADTVLHELTTALGITLGLLVLLSLTVWLITSHLSHRYSRSPVELSKGIQQVARGRYDYRIPELFDEFDSVRLKFNEMTERLQERERLQHVLEKFLSKELAEQAAREGLVLGGVEVDCTIMFTDFAGFSTITHTMNPQEVVTTLNEYFDLLIPIVKRHGGFPDKYIGDAIVALFGAPLAFSDHADKAVECAMEMQETLRKFNYQRKKDGKVVFEMRIGMNTGKVLVGAIGCDMKLEYTSIGESTNLANRMEMNCSIGNVLLSMNTYKSLTDNTKQAIPYPAKEQSMQVKGYAKAIHAVEIVTSPYTISKNAEHTGSHDFYRYGS